MQSVIDLLDGQVPSVFGARVMRWVPPESRDWVLLRDMQLSTECDDTASGDDLHSRAGTKPGDGGPTDIPGEPSETLTKVGHVE